MEVQASFPVDLSSATAARRLVEQTLIEWHCGHLVEDARLLVSELVINAVRHARTPAEVRMVLDRERLRVEVRDESLEPPAARPISPSSPSGRGLLIVDALADRWGYETASDHKVVWFELNPAAQAAGAA